MGKIVLQRGHVPRTTGATGAKGEQQFAIATCDVAARKLREIGHTPVIINADVSDASYRGDMFFAVHYDSSTNPTASGASVGYQTPEGRTLGNYWKRHYRNNGWTRAFRSDNYTPALAGYYGVREAVGQGNRHAIITESGFITNSHDAAMMHPDRTAVAIVACVVDVLGAKCPPNPNPPIGLPVYPGLVRMGDRGEAVKGWQRQLNARGYTLDVDGIFGKETYNAVLFWQGTHGLTKDGIAGPDTWHSLLFHR